MELDAGIAGGLIRSQRGWSAVTAMRRLGVREKSDERILGSGEFVERLIEQSDQIRKEHFSGHERVKRTVSYVQKICKKENVSVEALKSGNRRQRVSMVRSQLAKKLVEEWEFSLTETSHHLGVSPSAIAKTLYRSDKNNVQTGIHNSIDA